MLALTWVETAWWATLGAGLLVAVVVWALLELLRRSVHQVREAADEVLRQGGQLAQNTWTIQLLQTTRLHAREVAHELGQTATRGGNT